MIDEIFYLNFPVFPSSFQVRSENNDNEEKVAANFLFFRQHHQSLKFLKVNKFLV